VRDVLCTTHGDERDHLLYSDWLRDVADVSQLSTSTKAVRLIRLEPRTHISSKCFDAAGGYSVTLTIKDMVEVSSQRPRAVRPRSAPQEPDSDTADAT
jgi:hypothetical protein